MRYLWLAPLTSSERERTNEYPVPGERAGNPWPRHTLTEHAMPWTTSAAIDTRAPQYHSAAVPKRKPLGMFVTVTLEQSQSSDGSRISQTAICDELPHIALGEPTRDQT